MKRYCENCEEDVTEEVGNKDFFVCPFCGYPEEDIYSIANKIKNGKNKNE